MQTSFHPIIHFSVSVLCVHESTNTVICAVTFKSFTHILIFPSTALLSIHPPFLLFILIPLSTNTSLRVFHPHICPDRQTDRHSSTHPFAIIPVQSTGCLYRHLCLVPSTHMGLTTIQCQGDLMPSSGLHHYTLPVIDQHILNWSY